MYGVFNPTAETEKENNKVNARFGRILIRFIPGLKNFNVFGEGNENFFHLEYLYLGVFHYSAACNETAN